ncbi:MAG: hypothetical protein JWO95_2591 [Verrucomicrobiales bacterium]|nr:hypothetical protein [Verrucomicrobiales bacterium]
MSVLLRCRVDKPVLAKANKVTKKLGTSTPEMIRVFLTEIARTGRIPVTLSASNSDVVDVKRRNAIWKDLDDAKDW